jgi:microsomal dipeptidase-like Zn-dependent dipeptidase
MPAGLREGTTIEGLAGPDDYPALIDALRARGWDGEQLDGLLSANLLRFLRESLPVAE